MSSPVKRPTNRASKDQILAAFDQLNSEYKKLGAPPLRAPPRSTPVASGLNPRMASRDDAARADDASIGGDDRRAALPALGFGSAVSGPPAKLTAEASRLASLHHEVDQSGQAAHGGSTTSRSRTTRSRP